MSDSDRPPTATGEKKTFKVFNMVLFSVAAMLLLSQLTVTAMAGPTVVFWTIAIIILFFIPYGLVTSELGSTYPDAGGIYSWIVRAFGNRWGTRVSWWYWLNVALWVPSVYLMFSGVISSLFFDGKLNFWIQVLITIVLIWINFWVNARSLETGAWVSNLGAAITLGVILILGVVGVIYASTNGSATEWTLSSMLPQNGLPAVALALPIVIYNFLGFELMSSASTQMENPKRDVPKTILIAGSLIGLFYLIGTVGMQMLIPADEISETQGLIDALLLGFGGSTTARVIVTILAIGVLFCFFACLIPWTVGANIAAAESAIQGDLPKVFSKLHPKRKTPVGAAFLTSVVGTVFTVAYAALFAITDGRVEDLFWNLFAFSSVIFLLPYVALMLAFLKLRKIDPDATRPYRVPGGIVWAHLLTWIPVVLLLLAALFFVVNPFEFDPAVTVSILVGLGITVVIEEYFVYKSKVWQVQRKAEQQAANEVPVAE